MSSKQATVDYIVDQLASAGHISAKKMFGEYAIYHGDKVVALVCDDQLFIKPTAGGKVFLGEYEQAPPYPGAKSCPVVPADMWDDQEWMSRLVSITASELPAAKKKAAKKPR